MRTLLITLTPDLAKQLLDTNVGGNVRNVRPLHINKLAAQMREGKWKVTHQGIATNRDGKLIDGQHRCHAVIQSGVSIQILLTEGVDDTYVVDTGSARVAADYVKGSCGASTIAAAARMILSFKRGYRLGQLHGILTNEDVITFIRDNPRLNECVKSSKAVLTSTPATRTFVSALRFLLTERRPAEGNSFCDALQQDGIALRGQPASALRGRIFSNSLTRANIGAAALKAWKCHVDGKSIVQLHFGPEDGYAVS